MSKYLEQYILNEVSPTDIVRRGQAGMARAMPSAARLAGAEALGAAGGALRAGGAAGAGGAAVLKAIGRKVGLGTGIAGGVGLGAAMYAHHLGNTAGNPDLLKSTAIGSPDYFALTKIPIRYNVLVTRVREWAAKKGGKQTYWGDMETISAFVRHVLTKKEFWKRVHARENDIQKKASGRDDGFWETVWDSGKKSYQWIQGGFSRDEIVQVEKEFTKRTKIPVKRNKAVQEFIQEEYRKFANENDSAHDALGKWDGWAIGDDEDIFEAQFLKDLAVIYDKWIAWSLREAKERMLKIMKQKAWDKEGWSYSADGPDGPWVDGPESGVSPDEAAEAGYYIKKGNKITRNGKEITTDAVPAATAAGATTTAATTTAAPKLNLSNTSKPSWWDGASMPDDKKLIGKENHYMAALWTPVKSKLGGHKAAAKRTKLAAFNTKRTKAMKMPAGEERTKKLHEIIDARIKEMEGYYATIVGTSGTTQAAAVVPTKAQTAIKAKVKKSPARSTKSATQRQEELLKGTKHVDVKGLQKALLGMGFYDVKPGEEETTLTFKSGEPDGRIGGETKGAIKNLQRALGLTGGDVDGVYGPTTHGKFLEKKGEVRGSNFVDKSVVTPVAENIYDIVSQEIDNVLREAGKA
jgi:peptidoglycan hydrolase-like protein with peptidoglycan-binding domain